MRLQRLLLVALSTAGTISCGTPASNTDRVDSADPVDSPETGLVDSHPDTGPLPEFQLEVQTVLEDSFLLFQSNLPPDVADCLALAVQDAPCSDVDTDGLVDLWEDQVLDRLRPTLQFDEDEPLLEDSSAVLHGVGRIAPASHDSRQIRVFLMIGFSQDYGRCGLSHHPGDPERVVLDLERMEGAGAGDVRVIRAYTAAHEYTTLDHSTLLASSDMAQADFPVDPQTGEPRWRIFASDGKHALYPSISLCESAETVPCLDEDCAPDGVSDPLRYEQIPPATNAGEEGAPRLTDLSEIGFPGEQAWEDQLFCGGQERNSSCGPSVRSKLLMDPFE